MGSTKIGLCNEVKRAKTLWFSAVSAIFCKHETCLRKYWYESTDIYPVLFRMIWQASWPVLRRVDVKGGHNPEARGRCLGLSRGLQTVPYCHVPNECEPILDLIIKTVSAKHPALRFTSAQINLGLAAAIHVDQANIGPSAIITLGPRVGGQLWLHGLNEGSLHDAKNWFLFNGRKPHGTQPFRGERVSIVLFTPIF